MLERKQSLNKNKNNYVSLLIKLLKYLASKYIRMFLVNSR
jgi:hypothetical protein